MAITIFRPGQTVYHRTRPISGKVAECDGDTVYLVQDNGTEVEFSSRDLTSEPPAMQQPAVAVIRASGRYAEATPSAAAAAAVTARRVLARVLTDLDITPEHSRVLSIIPRRTLETVVALYERRPKAARFSTLTVAQKLNFIAEVTAIPYITMKQYSDRPGELGLMMGRGLAVSSGSKI